MVAQTVTSVQAQVPKLLKNLAGRFRTIKTVQNRFPTTTMLMFLHALVFNHLEYSALYLNQFSSTLLLSLRNR